MQYSIFFTNSSYRKHCPCSGNRSFVYSIVPSPTAQREKREIAGLVYEVSLDRVLRCSSCKFCRGDWARSHELTRGPPALISTFVYRGSSHRRESAACSKFDMVWLYRWTISVGRRGVISSFKLFLPAFDIGRERGGGRHPVGLSPCSIEKLRLCTKQRGMESCL